MIFPRTRILFVVGEMFFLPRKMFYPVRKIIFPVGKKFLVLGKMIFLVGKMADPPRFFINPGRKFPPRRWHRLCDPFFRISRSSDHNGPAGSFIKRKVSSYAKLSSLIVIHQPAGCGAG